MSLISTFREMVQAFSDRKRIIQVDVNRPSIEAARNPGELMQALTGNDRWKNYPCLGYEPLAQLVGKKDDPAILATICALYQTGMDHVRHYPAENAEDLSLTHMLPNNWNEGLIEVHARLSCQQALSEPSHKSLAEKFSGTSWQDLSEICVTMNRDCSFLKSHAREFKHYYNQAMQKSWPDLVADTSEIIRRGAAANMAQTFAP